MAQDIRDMFREEDPGNGEKLVKGHQQRFEARLDKEFPKQKENNFYFLKIAAILVVALGVGFVFWNNSDSTAADTEIVDVPVQVEEEEGEVIPENTFQLSDVSPEFKKIETYYLAGINMELAKLEVTNDNKALIDAFMLQLAELDKEYKRLNAELNVSGPNEQTVEAMIANLQLRLELLMKLKNKLNEIKQSKNKNNENLQA